ncbi:hypothetical protein CC2G_008334 [Coprinopsis cinerea AmutBmut pab1-1]|nr:hypothetical protein CC2G_008334 [Coprinopsis cinerea AmutBmut pab1-1]
MVNTPKTPARNKFGVDPRDKSALHELLLKTYATAPPHVEREVEDFLIEAGFLRPRIKTPSPKKPKGSLMISPFKLRHAAQESPAKSSTSTTSEASSSSTTPTPSKTKSTNLFKNFVLPKRRKTTTDSAPRAPKSPGTATKPVRAYTIPVSPRSRVVGAARRRSHTAVPTTKPGSYGLGVLVASPRRTTRGPVKFSEVLTVSPKPRSPLRMSKTENKANEEEKERKHQESLAAFKIYTPPPPIAARAHPQPAIQPPGELSPLPRTKVALNTEGATELKDQGTLKPLPSRNNSSKKDENSITNKASKYLKRTTLVLSILVLILVALVVGVFFVLVILVLSIVVGFILAIVRLPQIIGASQGESPRADGETMGEEWTLVGGDDKHELYWFEEVCDILDTMSSGEDGQVDGCEEEDEDEEFFDPEFEPTQLTS